MLMRISLIVAVIASLAAGVINFVIVKDKITATVNDRDAFYKDRNQEREAHRKFEKLAKDTQTKLDKTTADLKTAQDDRDKAVADAAEQAKKADALAETLKKTEGERNKAQDELAAWRALGIPVNEISNTIVALKVTRDERDVLITEKGILVTENAKLNNKIKSLLGEEYVVQEPVGLKGKVIVADPKYDFVVLNIGTKQGVIPDGVLLVNRSGKLIAKVQIKTVDQDRCIANVVPGWKIEDVMEGDQVFF